MGLCPALTYFYPFSKIVAAIKADVVVPSPAN
jgi:hypothetical protein